MKEQLTSQSTTEQELKYLENFGSIEEQEDHAWADHRPNSAETILDAHKQVDITPGKNRINREDAGQNRRLKEALGKDFGGTFKERDDWAKYLDARPTEENNSTAPEEEKDEYESKSISQLAKLLGQAEYHKDITSTTNIGEALIGKMDKVAEGFSSKDEDASTNFKDGGEANPRQAFYDRVMSIKDKEVERLKTEAEAKAQAEIQAKKKADIEAAKKLHEEAEARGEEVKDFGGAGIVVGKQEDMPKIIKSNQQPNKDVNDLGEAGVLKDEGLDDYYDDPTAELPKQDFLPVLYEGPRDNLPAVIPKNNRGLFRRIKDKVQEALAKDPAVRFDGKDHTGQTVPGKTIGDAIVDTRDREYKTRHYVAVAALGVAAVGVAYLATKGIHSPIVPTSPNEVPVPNRLGTIHHAETARDVATGALDNFRGKGYTVEGDGPRHLSNLVKSLKESGSLDLIVGKNPDGSGHVVSAAADLKDGLTGNAYASQQVAIKPEDLKEFMELAEKAGITITKS